MTGCGDKDGRDDDGRRDDGERRVADGDLQRGLGDADVLLHIRAVGDHDAHRQRERIEELAEGGEQRFIAELGEIGREEVGDPFQRAALAEDIDHQRHGNDGEQRHQDLADALDPLLYAEHDDEDSRRREDQKEKEGLPRVGDETFKIRVRVRGGAAARDEAGSSAQKGDNVLDHPAADDAVIGHDDDGDDQA